MSVTLLPASERPALANADTVWNVAYGSNLVLSKLQSRTPDGRRTIQPLSQQRVTVPGWTLDFQLPAIPPVEPVMANARASADDPTLHGVAYELTKEDYDSLCMSEHCATANLEPSYVEHAVTAVAYDTDARIPALVFALPASHAPAAAHAALLARFARPSARYLGLIRAGACAHGLSAAHASQLDAVAPAARAGAAARLVGALAVAGVFLVFGSPRLLRGAGVVKRGVLPAALLLHARRERAAAQGRRARAAALAAALWALLAPLAALGAVNVVFVRGRVLFGEGE